jgi:hypothetical protein
MFRPERTEGFPCAISGRIDEIPNPGRCPGLESFGAFSAGTSRQFLSISKFTSLDGFQFKYEF